MAGPVETEPPVGRHDSACHAAFHTTHCRVNASKVISESVTRCRLDVLVAARRIHRSEAIPHAILPQ